MNQASLSADPRWHAVRGRNSSATFIYAVLTTGIYCRPGCPSRLPLPENVRFFASSQEAEAAGYRPCQRCMAQDKRAQQTARIIAACRHLENTTEMPDLNALAREAGFSPGHFHRLFKAHTGLTPRAYAEAQRAQRLRGELEQGRSVTEALYSAGFGSSGRLYAATDQVLGMTPTRYRKGGSRETIRYVLGESSLGTVLVGQSSRGICAILLGDAADTLLAELRGRFPQAELQPGESGFETLIGQVIQLIENPRLGLALPLDIRGTAFQARVWQALREIPPGATLSYAQLAARLDLPKAVRAVAGACAANSLAVAIPCHRIVRSDGELSGYRWGVARKRELLRREQQD